METMEGSKNRRATFFKIKLVFTIVVIVVVVAYVRNNFTMFSKWRTSKHQTVHSVRDSVRRQLSDRTSNRGSRTSWDLDPYSKQNKWGQKTGTDLSHKDSFRKRTDDKTEDKKLWSDQNRKEGDTFSKEKKYEFKQATYSTPKINSGTEKKINKTVSNDESKYSTKKTNAALIPDSLGKKEANGSSTIRRKKITFKTIINIAREILDRLNISSLNASRFKLNETNKLSHTAVGNISKEIRKQKLSRSIAQALIMVLARGNGSARNRTLGKALWKDYVDNTKELRFPQNYDGSERTRYMDQYKRADRTYSRKRFEDDPIQQSHKPNYRDEGDRPRPLYKDDRPRDRGHLQDNDQPPRYRDDRNDRNDRNAPRYRDDRDTPSYRDGPRNRDDRNAPRYRYNADKPSYRDEPRNRDDRNAKRYTDDRDTPRYRDGPINRDDRNAPRYGDIADKPSYRDGPRKMDTIRNRDNRVASKYRDNRGDRQELTRNTDNQRPIQRDSQLQNKGSIQREMTLKKRSTAKEQQPALEEKNNIVKADVKRSVGNELLKKPYAAEASKVKAKINL